MALTIEIKVAPSSGRQYCVLDKTGALKCFLKSPPERGLANEELITLLAKAIGVPKQHVSILLGATGRKKVIKINQNVTFSELLRCLGVEVQQSLLAQSPTNKRKN